MSRPGCDFPKTGLHMHGENLLKGAKTFSRERIWLEHMYLSGCLPPCIWCKAMSFSIKQVVLIVLLTNFHTENINGFQKTSTPPWSLLQSPSANIHVSWEICSLKGHRNWLRADSLTLVRSGCGLALVGSGNSVVHRPLVEGICMQRMPCQMNSRLFFLVLLLHLTPRTLSLPLFQRSSLSAARCIDAGEKEMNSKTRR